MGYAQWITIHVINSMSSSKLSIANAVPSNGEGWGKFYKDGNKDVQIYASEINKITVPPGGSVTISSCGPLDAAAGTEGYFDMYDGQNKIGRVYWDCPWDKNTNNFGLSKLDTTGYWVKHGSWNRDSGGIGSVDVEVGKKG